MCKKDTFRKIKGSTKILYVMAAMAGLTILFIIADINHLFPWTDQTSNRYDWLSFTGSIMSGIATLALGYVTIKQNERQNQQFKEEREKNEVLIRQATQAPKISFMERQVFIDKENELRVNIRNESELLLENITFRSIKLTELKDEWHDYDNKESYTKEIIKKSPTTTTLEYTYTAKGEICSANVQTKINKEQFKIGKYYRLEFNMLIKNQANITSKGLFYILVSTETPSEYEEKHGHLPLKTYWQFSRKIEILTQSNHQSRK